MAITTIIPTIGRETLWTRAVPSVRCQRADWRIIIVGDGVDIPSFDDSRIRVLRIERPDYPEDEHERWRIQGVRAFDHGISHVETEWWSYLADDDDYMPDHHGELLRWAGNVDVSIGAWEFMRHGSIRWPQTLPPGPMEVMQGAYIIRTVLDHRPKETDLCIDRHGWDADWWDRLSNRPDVRYHLSKKVVARYHQEHMTRPADER